MRELKKGWGGRYTQHPAESFMLTFFSLRLHDGSHQYYYPIYVWLSKNYIQILMLISSAQLRKCTNVDFQFVYYARWPNLRLKNRSKWMHRVIIIIN